MGAETPERAAIPDVRHMVLVLHGPEIFDSGNARWLSQVLGPGRIVVAGVMARAAAEESGLPCEFMSIPPSMAIRTLQGPCLLGNQGKTPDSGRIFGEMVASRVGSEGLVQVECASREVICWNRKPDYAVDYISKQTGYPVIERSVPCLLPSQGSRTIRGCIPGESVFVNGTVIGTAKGSEVVLRSAGGKVIPVSGLTVKHHGLEKLQRTGPVEISQAWCKSGRIRSQNPRPRLRKTRKGRVLFVDHCGHQIYRMIDEGEICGMVTVGDDTTAVCGHIGVHLGIPVLGIIDGDSDNIVPERYAEGSVLAVAQGLSDDELGKEISYCIPDGDISWEECVALIIACIGERAEIRTPD